jgi:hypothetical protein
LGIPPHLAFFQFLFTLKPHPTRVSPNLVGGAGFQLRERLKKHLFGRPRTKARTLSGFTSRTLTVPSPFSSQSPTPHGYWTLLPSAIESAQVPNLIKILKEKKAGLTPMSILVSCLIHASLPSRAECIQSLTLRELKTQRGSPQRTS